MLVVNSTRSPAATNRIFAIHGVDRRLLPESPTTQEDLKLARAFLAGPPRIVEVSVNPVIYTNGFAWVSSYYDNLVMAIPRRNSRDVTGLIRISRADHDLTAFMRVLAPEHEVTYDEWDDITRASTTDFNFRDSLKNIGTLIADLVEINKMGQGVHRTIKIKDYMAGSSFEKVSFPLQFQYSTLEKMDDQNHTS